MAYELKTMEQKWNVGLIRVVTMTDVKMRDLHGQKIMEYFPQLTVESCCIPDQPEGIHSPETRARAVPKIIDAAKAFSGKDAIIVSCADDPGVAELRSLVSVPVIGAGSSVAVLARRYGPKAGVLGITDYAPPPYVEIFGGDLINPGRPDGVHTTFDLMTPEGRLSVMRTARYLKEAGVQSIALSCTGMSTIGIAAVLRQATGLPVVDPVLAEGICTCYECLTDFYGNRGYN